MNRPADPATVNTGSSLVIDVQVACDDADIPTSHTVQSWVSRALAGSGKAIASNAELSVRLVDKDEVRRLNRDYRHKDAVTNVLSFPAGAISGLPADAVATLGDIVICAAVVHEEAAEQGKTIEGHWAHLLVHGTLHLLGYDHETDAEADEMEALEVNILKEFGLADPYVTSC